MEEYLIDRCKKGDTDAFEALVKEYQLKIYNIAFRMMGNEQDAFDMSQEILIKIYRSISKFEGQSKFSTWVYKISTNTCLDELRRRAKRPKGNKEIEEILIIDKEPTPEEKYIQKERKKQIEKAILNLSEEHKLAVILRDIQGLSYDEISNVLDISVGTVKSRISRARKQLQELLLKSEIKNTYFK